MSRSTLKTLVPIAALLAGLGTAHAQPPSPGQLQAVAQVLERNTLEQEQLASDLAHGRIDTAQAELMLAREGRLYGVEAQAFSMAPSGAELRGIVEMQTAVLQARSALDTRHVANSGARDVHTHELMVTALRDAAAQRRLAHDWAAGRLTLGDLGREEAVQAGAFVPAPD